MATRSKNPAHPRLVTDKRGASDTPTARADRDTLGKLRAHIDAIETRLKRANKLTRTSVKALQSSYATLDQNLDKNQGGDNPATALTTHIEALSNRLTGMIEQTRLDVAHDLKVVLSDPRLHTLSKAITKANQRLTMAEHNQAEAINTINVHIAHLATAVDERLRGERRQRQNADKALERRLDGVEQDSAEAFKSIGEKIIIITEDMTTRLQNYKGEIAEDALKRQHDYQEHKHTIAQRIEAIEDERRNQLPTIERGLARLSTRLEALEQCGSFEDIPKSVAPAYQVFPAIEEANTGAVTQDNKIISAAEPQADMAGQLKDAFAALEQVDAQVDMQDISPPQFVTNPDISEQTPLLPTSSTPIFAPDFGDDNTASGHIPTPKEFRSNDTPDAAHEPQVFSPRDYAPHSPEYVAQTTSEPAPYVVTDSNIQEYSPGQTMPPLNPEAAPPNSEIAQTHFEMAKAHSEKVQAPIASTLSPELPPFAVSGPPPMPEDNNPEPYSLETPLTPQEPALAQEPTMENARPGAVPHKKTRWRQKKENNKIKKPGNGGSGGKHGMIRKIALFGGVAVVALFAYKTIVPKIFGADEQININAQSAPAKQLANITMSGDTDFTAVGNTAINQIPNPQPVETIEPIGDYAEAMAPPNLGPNVEDANANKQTLETAAASGDAIAQFQLGLSHLEAGRDAEAVRLIRLAANQNQPAAQYRLAKLYEAGIGVEVNGKTAKSLLMRSAKADNRIAMHDLGHYFATGADGSSPDIAQAVKWFSQAAERGVLDSQFNLGVLYQGGSGVDLSLSDAYFWYTIAGMQGDNIAKQRSEAIKPELSSDNLGAVQARIKAFAPKPVNNTANGVFTNLPWIQKKPKLDTEASVKATQKILASLGYNVGKPDGAMGPNTRNAIIKFERANGLPETGLVNAGLIARLELAAGA